MNILFFHSLTIDPNKGGIERVTHTLGQEFERLQHNCYFLAAKDRGVPLEAGEQQLLLPDRKKVSSRRNARFFELLLRKYAIDRVIFQWGDGKRFPFFDVCERRQIPVVVAIHTDPAFYERHSYSHALLRRLKGWLRRRRQSKIYRYNSRHAKYMVLLSDRFRQAYLKHFPDTERVMAEKKLIAIANPSTYAPDYSALAAKKKELLFVGRMEARVKQPQLLLQLWQKMQDRFPDWSLRFVGGGHEEQAMRRLAEDLNLSRVWFEGFCDPQEFYRQASIFCMMSAYEGFGMVLIEAGANGCVPVAFDSFVAVNDIIGNEVNGYVVPAFDMTAYENVLVTLMQDPQLRDRLARNAISGTERFSENNVALAWLSLLSP